LPDRRVVFLVSIKSTSCLFLNYEAPAQWTDADHQWTAQQHIFDRRAIKRLTYRIAKHLTTNRTGSVSDRILDLNLSGGIPSPKRSWFCITRLRSNSAATVNQPASTAAARSSINDDLSSSGLSYPDTGRTGGLWKVKSRKSLPIFTASPRFIPITAFNSTSSL
jgi:hypothetical protein